MNETTNPRPTSHPRGGDRQRLFLRDGDQDEDASVGATADATPEAHARRQVREEAQGPSAAREVHLLFGDDVTVCTGHPQNPVQQGCRHETDAPKSAVFLCISTKQSKREIQKTIIFTTA